MWAKRHQVVLVLVALWSVPNLRAAETLPPAAAWVPAEAILSIQVTDPGALIDRAYSDDVVGLITSLPFYKQAMSQPEAAQALDFVKFLEYKQDAKLPEILRKLTGGGITLAAGPNEEFLLIVDAQDADVLSEVHEMILNMVKGGENGGGGQIASAEYKGVTGWTVGNNEAHAIIGNRFVMANKPEILKAVIDMRERASNSTLDQLPAYQEATAALGKANVKLYANMAVLKQAPDFGKGLEESDNPLTRLLFAPVLDAIKQTNWLAGGLTVEKEQVELEFVADGIPTEASSFAVPDKEGRGAMPNLVVPGQIAGFSFYRDLHRFYAAKDELFPERTSGLIFFENMMGIFFTGRDLTEEVLAETMPDVRLVVAEQKFEEEKGIPVPQFPGFAFVVQLKHPEKFQPVVEEAWQKAIGLVNFTRGQNALPGLIIDKSIEGDTKYTTAAFSAADESDKSAADVRFNFQPSIAIQGNHLILSSSDALTRDLIRALSKEHDDNTQPTAGTDVVGLLNGPALRSILEANRDILVRQSMVEKGNSRDQANGEITALLTVLDYLRELRIETSNDGQLGRLRFQLDYHLQ